ncbi:MAG: PIN domain-containing protein [Candidatus Caenarcaniphilales bacterium]|nr:PIN domain-containing protein [Candidatus Caenarcaniphilales bacterium]
MFSSNFTVIYDANVLYDSVLRDLLVQLATEELFKARWTLQIQQEWSSKLLKELRRKDKKDFSIKKNKINRTIELMNEAVEDCLVRDYDHYIDILELPDLRDKHVLAAGIKCGAQVIVTDNSKHFPQKELEKYDIEAQNPAIFTKNVIGLTEFKVISSVKSILNRLINPPLSIEELIEMYRNRGLESLCSFLEKNMHEFN